MQNVCTAGNGMVDPTMNAAKFENEVIETLGPALDNSSPIMVSTDFCFHKSDLRRIASLLRIALCPYLSISENVCIMINMSSTPSPKARKGRTCKLVALNEMSMKAAKPHAPSDARTTKAIPINAGADKPNENLKPVGEQLHLLMTMTINTAIIKIPANVAIALVEDAFRNASVSIE